MKHLCQIGFIATWSISVALGLTGCVQNDLEEKEANEKKIIQQYLTDHNISADTKTEGGIYYIEEVAGTGLTPVEDEYVVLNFTGRYLETGVIRETSYESLKGEWSLAERFTDYLYGPVKMVYGYSMPGINEALSLMKEGGKATVIIPSDKANYDYQPLLYELELLRVIKKPDAFEDSMLNIYAKKHFGDEARIDTSVFIWVKVTEPSGSVIRFGTGDTLYFNYTGRLMDTFGDSVETSRIFDSNTGNTTIKYIYGQNNISEGKMLYKNKIPVGLKTALDSVQNQSRLSVLMKYDQAFGVKGVVHDTDNYIIMPVYQNVLYDIEVVDIKENQ